MDTSFYENKVKKMSNRELAAEHLVMNSALSSFGELADSISIGECLDTFLVEFMQEVGMIVEHEICARFCDNVTAEA